MKVIKVLGIGGVSIKAGDIVKCWVDCGENATKDQTYKVVVTKKNYRRRAAEPKLAINPIDDGKCFTACSCYSKWELIKKD